MEQCDESENSGMHKNDDGIAGLFEINAHYMVILSIKLLESIDSFKPE